MNNKQSLFHRNKKYCKSFNPLGKLFGFTLIELLVVITIIGILVALGTAAYGTARTQARDAKRKADLEQIRSALEMYRADNRQYPVGRAGSDLSCWINNSTTDFGCHPLGRLVAGGYMQSVPIDPGKNTYTTGETTCGGSQFYSYISNGITYKLSAVVEVKGSNGCNSACDFIWGLYQYCVTNP